MAFITALSLTSVSKFTAAQVCPLSRNSKHALSLTRPSHSPVHVATPMMVNSLAVYKTALLEKVLPLNFGRSVADIPREQAEIEELARQVESTNKSSNPSADPNLSAKWNMVYTTSTSILRIGLPKFLQPVKIIQYIDAAKLYAKNEEVFKIGPFEFSNAVEAKLKPLSNSNFSVNFVQFILFQTFKFNVENNPRFRGALDITYLDEDLRISRGDKGNLFVLVKDKEANYP